MTEGHSHLETSVSYLTTLDDDRFVVLEEGPASHGQMSQQDDKLLEAHVAIFILVQVGHDHLHVPSVPAPLKHKQKGVNDDS